MPAAPARDPLYRGYRVPAESISSAVLLYSRFPLSHRDSEDLLAARGVQVSDEAIRLWCRTFGPAFAAGLRRHRRPAAGKWHLDEVQLKSNGKKREAALAVAGGRPGGAGAGHPSTGWLKLPGG